jgi:Ca2+-binding RTX toxin-like protein
VTLLGRAANDDITASDNGSNVSGGDGNDDLVGGLAGDFFPDFAPGNDTVDGNGEPPGGADSISYFPGGGAGVTVDLAITGPQDTGAGGPDTITDVEDLFGTIHDDVLLGTNGDNWLSGSFRPNTEASGDDVLIGRGGNDQLAGHTGNDTASYEQGSAGGVTVNLGTTVPSKHRGSGSGHPARRHRRRRGWERHGA